VAGGEQENRPLPLSGEERGKEEDDRKHFIKSGGDFSVVKGSKALYRNGKLKRGARESRAKGKNPKRDREKGSTKITGTKPDRPVALVKGGRA